MIRKRIIRDLSVRTVTRKRISGDITMACSVIRKRIIGLLVPGSDVPGNTNAFAKLPRRFVLLDPLRTRARERVLCENLQVLSRNRNRVVEE